METQTVLDKILADIPLFKEFNKLMLGRKDFEVIRDGTLGANHWRLGEYDFERVSSSSMRFYVPTYWVIRKHGNVVAQTRHYKYCLGLCYKKLGLLGA